jgi:mxaD protein
VIQPVTTRIAGARWRAAAPGPVFPARRGSNLFVRDALAHLAFTENGISVRRAYNNIRGTNLKTSLLGLALFAMVASVGSAFAQATAPVLHETNVVQIAAPPAKVWAIIQNFSDLTWVPVVKSSTATEGNTVGSVRTLDLGGPKLVERLKAYNAAGMTYTYAITEDPANVKSLPVTSYTSTITVKPAGSGSRVVWIGSFKRADPGPKPAATMDDKTATTAIGGVYTAGLDNLKKKAEGAN